jgi:hypothetical protein
MNTSHIPRLRALRSAAAAAVLAGCGGGAEVLVVPLFEFGFTGSSGATTIQVFFLPDTPATATGTFDSVNMNVDAQQVQYDGTWSNCNFALAVKAGQTAIAPGAAAYDGHFQGVDTIVLTPKGAPALPVLTLQRQGNATRSFAC